MRGSKQRKPFEGKVCRAQQGKYCSCTAVRHWRPCQYKATMVSDCCLRDCLRDYFCKHDYLSNTPLHLCLLGFGSRAGTSATRWIWCRLDNSAHSHNKSFSLCHWHRESDAKPVAAAASQESSSEALLDEKANSQTDGTPPASRSVSVSSGPLACSYVAKSDYPPAAFNKKAQVLRYSPACYSKHISVRGL